MPGIRFIWYTQADLRLRDTHMQEEQMQDIRYMPVKKMKIFQEIFQNKCSIYPNGFVWFYVSTSKEL